MVARPFGLTEPFKVAPVSVIAVAAEVVTVGGFWGAEVVKVRSAPLVVPALLVATSRK